MSGRLILLRHGETHANVEGRLDTRPPGAELTALGRRQALAFARSGLAAPGLLVHSVAVRAAQTAAVIAAEAAVAAQELEGVHEVQAGDLEDRTDDDAITHFKAVYQRWHEGDLDLAMPGGESGREVLDRYLSAVEGLRARHLEGPRAGGGDVVIVSHGCAIRLVAATLAGVDRRFALDRHLANTEAVVLEPVSEGRWNCVQWGSRTPPFRSVPETQPMAPMAEVLGPGDPMG